MSIIADVFKELFKMFVADMRLTLAILGGVALVAVMLGQGVLGPMTAAGLLVLLTFAVLAEAVLREARARRKR